MADVVNLRRARKSRLRAEAAKAGEANRAAYGRSKAERAEAEAAAGLAARRLDNHRLVAAPDDGVQGHVPVARSNRSSDRDVTDFEKGEQDVVREPVPSFRHHALDP